MLSPWQTSYFPGVFVYATGIISLSLSRAEILESPFITPPYQYQRFFFCLTIVSLLTLITLGCMLMTFSPNDQNNLTALPSNSPLHATSRLIFLNLTLTLVKSPPKAAHSVTVFHIMAMSYPSTLTSYYVLPDSLYFHSDEHPGSLNTP